MTKAHAAILLGVPMPRDTLAEITTRSLESISNRGRKLVFACANPHSLVEARRDAALFEALNQADLVVADGVGVSLMAKFARIDVGPRITGSDYFFSVMTALNQSGNGRVFFFGSSDKVLNLIAERFARDFPNLTLCGTLSPPFRPWSEDENRLMVEQINAAKPDVVWVGMTAPKQEKWVQANRLGLDVPVIGSIGAVFDFYAGTYPRAPQWMCRMGIEWVYRLLREPRRMWKRNFVSSPHFVGLVIWQHVIRQGQRG